MFSKAALWLLLWTLYLVDCLSPFNLVLSLKFFPPIWNIFLCLFHIFFYVLVDQLHLAERVALYRGYPVEPSSTIPRWSPEPYAPRVSLVWAVCTLLLWLGHVCFGWLLGRPGTQPGVRPSHDYYLYMMCWAYSGHDYYKYTDRTGWTLVWLVARPHCYCCGHTGVRGRPLAQLAAGFSCNCPPVWVAERPSLYCCGYIGVWALVPGAGCHFGIAHKVLGTNVLL